MDKYKKNKTSFFWSEDEMPRRLELTLNSTLIHARI